MSEPYVTRDGRSARLDRVLTELVSQVPEIEAAAVVSFDGLPMASALPPDMDEDRVAAMSAALLALGERAAEGLGRGELSQVYVEGADGTVFLISADDEAVLVAVAAKGAKTGLMLFEVRRAAAAVADVLRIEDAPTSLDGHESLAPRLAPAAPSPYAATAPLATRSLHAAPEPHAAPPLRAAPEPQRTALEPHREPPEPAEDPWLPSRGSLPAPTHRHSGRHADREMS